MKYTKFPFQECVVTKKKSKVVYKSYNMDRKVSKSCPWNSSIDNLGSLFGECIEHEITLRILSNLYQICIDDSA